MNSGTSGGNLPQQRPSPTSDDRGRVGDVGCADIVQALIGQRDGAAPNDVWPQPGLQVRMPPREGKIFRRAVGLVVGEYGYRAGVGAVRLEMPATLSPDRH